MRLFTRLVVGAIAVLAVTAAVLLYASDRWLRRDLERDFSAELERQARLVAAALSEHPTQLNVVAHRFGSALGRRVTFIAPDGTVLGDSDFDDASLALLENHLTRPEVAAALAGRTGVSHRLSASTNREELKVAIAAWPGVVRISAPLAQVEVLVGAAERAILLATLAALVLGAAIAALAGRAVARPITNLAVAAQAAAAGGIPRYPHTLVPEVKELIRSVRSMHQQLAARIGELRREREETVALIDAMVEGVLAVNSRGEVMTSNAAARSLLGFGPEDALPNLRELFHQREAREIVDQVLSGQSVPAQEIELDRRSVLVTARSLPNGGAVLGLLDTSDLKRLQAVRRDFVANVSHELKTPLTNILGYTETLLANQLDDATSQKFLTIIHQNAERMQRLVDDLLDLARLESGGWEPSRQRVALRPLALDAWGAFADQARTKRVEFGLELPNDLELEADPDAVRQILANLLDNALRHTPADGQIVIGGRATEAGVEITVRDTGIGIPSEHVPRVFERFYRVDPGRSRKEGGTGLGLAIVKHLVEGHGGQVELTSAVGQGTSVSVHFPPSSVAVST